MPPFRTPGALGTERLTCHSTPSYAKQVTTRGPQRNIRHPPGKKGSLGDALNWEALLAEAPPGEDLHLVSDDRDYASPLDRDQFSLFLQREWSEKKHSEVRFHHRLSEFFREHFPEIKLASEPEIAAMIEKLANSESFKETHKAVARLNTIPIFTDAQADDIVEAAVLNSQVHWIADDPDVYEFLTRTIRNRTERLDPDNITALTEYMRGGEV